MTLTKKLLLAILVLGLFLRSYHPLLLFMYGHDHDLSGWVVRDIVENHHFRLIGQETSVHGVYIGALWYYLLVPFYVLWGMSPVGSLLLSIGVGLFSIWSVWFVLKRIWSRTVGLLGAFIYSASFYTVMTDREVVPTTPVMVWSVWYLFTLHLLLTKKVRWGLIFSAILFALTWHLNLALLLLLPVSLLALVLGKTWPKVRDLRDTIVVGFVSVLPFLLFELKTHFLQTQSILHSVGGSGRGVDFWAKIDRTTTLISKNIRGLTYGDALSLPNRYPLYALLLIFVFLVWKKKISRAWAIIFSLWFVLYTVFFSLNPLNLSEYYLNGMIMLWIVPLAVFVSSILSNQKLKTVGIILVTLFGVVNVVRFLDQPINRSGYVDRLAIAKEIKADAAKHNYPCVAVSYITSPGNNLGYRYFFYMENLHVNLPMTEAPVYSIVFPLSMVDRTDKNFGVLGLIYPDYERYTPEGIEKSCSGDNQNLTEPMFGFTR